MNDLMTKSFMSYVELKKAARQDLESNGGDVTDEEMWRASTDDTLRNFFEQANAARSLLNEIRQNLLRLQNSNEESRSLSNPETLKSLRRRINDEVTSVLKKARRIKIILEDLDRQNSANRRISECKEGTPIDRTRISVTNGLRKNLKDLMMDFQNLRQKMMAEYKETVERRYYTVTGVIPEEEMIERIISDKDGEELLQKAISEHGKGKVMETVVEIQDRYDAAKEVEKSLLELHQVFLDMAVMVEVQGEKMDDIEHHVSHAAEYVKGGVKQLGSAKEYQRKNRKWLIIGLVLLLILVLVVIVPVTTSLKSS